VEDGRLLACPYCGREFQAATSPAAQFVRCTQCSQEFVVSPTHGGDESMADDAPKSEPPAGDELDGLRIRQVAGLRRAAFRSRSYCLIAVAGCIVGAAEAFYYAILRFSDGRFLWPMFYLLAALGLMYLGWHFARLMIAFHRGARRTRAGEPTVPPDLSQLSDGSQIARNLENLR
jgi:hypothetical protein